MSDRDVAILRGVTRGMRRGALAGGMLSIATGAALAAGPAGAVALPAIIAVKVGVVSQWAAGGSIVGGIAGAAGAWARHRQVASEFERVFGEAHAVA